MAAATPITIKEAFTLQSVGINSQFITSTHVTMDSDKYICVGETSPNNRVVVIDITMPRYPWTRHIIADSALINPNSTILAFKVKAQYPGTTQDRMQLFNIALGTKMKSSQMLEQVVFWKWVTPKMLGLVTQTSVYHWSIEGESEPVKMFDRTANLASNCIINYRCDPTEKWLVLIGTAPGSTERPQLVKGNMQLFSVEQQSSQVFEAHAASFATCKVPGNENPSTVICFASKTINAGQVTSRLHVIALGAQPGKPTFQKKQADLFFPPIYANDFPVAMEISHKYGLIYVITKLGLLFVYDLETATAIYQNRICVYPIFLTSEASLVGGFYAVNRRGQVLLITINEATIVQFVSGQLNNLELAINLAKRGNLPGAGNLTSESFCKKFGSIQLSTEKKAMAEVENAISSIIGMNDLKQQIRNWAKVMLLNEKRRALGHNLGARKLPHMAFLGNPGTGKTMVARILGNILLMVGILPTDRVTEVQRTDLVGEYIGQTGPRTRAKINEAEGGILFVDEAYRLVPPQGKGSQDYGLEALEEIMSVMDTGKIVVIFAGYDEQMKSVIASNEGFRRRVTKIFNFSNYNSMDLAQIVHVKMTKQAVDSPFYGFKLDPLCGVEAIREVIERETTEELRNKMNGGLADLMLVNALEKLDLRLDFDNVDSNELVTITMEDLENGVQSLVK